MGDNVKQGQGHEKYEVIRSILAKCGVAGHNQEAVEKIILRVLDCTDGQAIHNAIADLHHIEAHVCDSFEAELLKKEAKRVAEETAAALAPRGHTASRSRARWRSSVGKINLIRSLRGAAQLSNKSRPLLSRAGSMGKVESAAQERSSSSTGGAGPLPKTERIIESSQRGVQGSLND